MRTFVLALSLTLATGVDGAAAQAGKGAREETKTITGVIDQKGADFVIAEPENLEPVAVLQGVGFSNESFARFVGVPVRVRGTLVTEKNRKILRVRRLSDIQETPQPKP